MRFSICVIEPEGYKYTHFLYDLCKYLCFSIESAGHECCILRNKLSSGCTNIIVGAHNQTDRAFISQVKNTGHYILLNTEIITDNSINNWSVQKTFADVYLPLMRQATVVWTGVKKNIEALNKLDVEADQILWGYHPLMEEIHHKRNKDIDFLFCGSITPHRKTMLEQLAARGGRIVTMFDDAAMYRNDLIARARVNLAPNQGPGMNHLGGGRVLYLVNNHSIVVVERCIDQGRYEHCFSSADTEQWVDLCMETLRHPDLEQITEKYYERFKEIRMADSMQPLLESFIRKSQSAKRNLAQPEKNCQIEKPQANKETNPPLPEFEHSCAVAGLTSIIVIVQNRLDQTKKCIKSIRKHTPEHHEIIFVDNGSNDETVRWLQSQVKANKNYRLIENRKNIGSSASCNQGINISQGQYIVLINSGVVTGEGWLHSMLQCFNAGDDVGLIGPLANYARGIQQVKDDSYQLADDLNQYTENLKEKYRHRRIPCGNVEGFCMLFKRTLAEKIGLFDQRFGAGDFEDEDFCIRASIEGYTNYIAGDVFVQRQGGKRASGDRKIIEEKWTLSMSSPEGRKLAVLKAIELANEFYSKGKTDQAAEIIISCIKLIPDAKQIYNELARIFIESKRFSEAWEVIGSMPDTVKNDLKGLEYAGYIKEGLGFDEEAAAYVDKMLASNSKSAAAVNLLGILAYKKGEKEKAADYFRKAIDNDPGYGEAYTNLGVLYWGMDKQVEALEYLKKGFILSPCVPDASSLYYSVVSSMGAYADAEADFRETSRLYPHNKSLAFLFIDTLLQQNKLTEAMRKIEDALALFGLDEGTLNAALAVREKMGPRQIENMGKKGTLSVCMIVKNEERHMVRCLKSIRDIADELIVVDTGSTDKTKEIAMVFGAKVYELPWTGDFAAARNYSLNQATGNWILILDADEVISPKDFKEIKEIIHKKSSSPAAYSIVTRNYITAVSIIGWTPNKGEYPEEAGTGWVVSAKVRLFTRRPDVFFSNPVHEVVEDSLNKAKIPILPCNVIVHHYGKLDAEKDKQKGEDYYLLGKIKYESDPTNAKYIIELAKQAQVLNKHEEAVELWEKLIDLLNTEPDSLNFKEIASITYGDPLAEIYTQLAAAYLMLDRFADALEASRKSMISKIKLKEYVHVYAHCEIIAGSLEKAFCALEEVLKTNPEYPPALLLTAVIYCLHGKKEKMQECFQILRHSTVNVPPLLHKYAKQLHTNGKKNEAMLILNAMMENKINDDQTEQLMQYLQS